MRRLPLLVAVLTLVGIVSTPAGGSALQPGPASRANGGSGSMSGTVTDTDGNPLEFVCVEGYLDGEQVGSTFTDADGTYTIWGLETGLHKVRFWDCSAGGYATEWYLDRADEAAADPVLVVDGLQTAGVDAALAEHVPTIETSDLSDGLTPRDLAELLAGPGVTVSNVSYAGHEEAAGMFTGGREPIGFDEGVILTSGGVDVVRGPNRFDEAGRNNGKPGDAQLTSLSRAPTYDAAVLAFDFVPNAAEVTFSYVFSSEEYNEFVFSGFNDVFAFFVNGENCALVPGTDDPVSVDNVNGGNAAVPHEPPRNPEYYRNNDMDDGGGDIDTEMDGLTVVLTCRATVTPGTTNRMRLAIADASDRILDSAVFLRRGSLSTCVEDGLDALRGTPAGGTASGTVHDIVEPALGDIDGSLEGTLHAANCDVVVPTEDAVDGALP